MNNFKIYIVLGILIISLSGVIVFLSNRLKEEKAMKELYQKNTEILMNSIQTYKVNDSLNAVSIGMLELKLSEYKKYRAADLELISSLKIDKKRLEQITTTQMQTICELKGTVKDSIVIVNNYIVDTLRCLEISDKWFALNGCINKKNEFSGTFENRDSLVYVEHVVPKKFLFIKWGVKERKQEIISKNPNTKILNAEYISIRK